MPAQISENLYKLVLLGHYSVGKTSLSQRFCLGNFSSTEEPTIGAAFMTKSVKNKNSEENIKYNIWDTAGQERYKSLIPMYYRGADSALLVFDLTNKETLKSARGWLQALESEKPKNFLRILIGNKNDLETERRVDFEEANNLATEFNAVYYEVSAKTGEGVEKMFSEIGEMLSKVKKSDKKRKEVEDKFILNKNSSFCCGLF